jgi:hypothetical protein
MPRRSPGSTPRCGGGALERAVRDRVRRQDVAGAGVRQRRREHDAEHPARRRDERPSGVARSGPARGWSRRRAPPIPRRRCPARAATAGCGPGRAARCRGRSPGSPGPRRVARVRGPVEAERLGVEAVHREHGDVELGVVDHDGGAQLLAADRHRRLLHAGDHVRVGHDPLVVVDEPRALDHAVAGRGLTGHLDDAVRGADDPGPVEHAAVGRGTSTICSSRTAPGSGGTGWSPRPG